jgi:hypothetical protein
MPRQLHLSPSGEAISFSRTRCTVPGSGTRRSSGSTGRWIRSEPAAQDLRHAPRLRDATARCDRRLRFEALGNASDAVMYRKTIVAFQAD